MTTQQTEALRLAAELDDGYPLTGDAISAATELRRQHARIAELESQLAQRFDAADMATAAAQGFRDGAAKEQQAGAFQAALDIRTAQGWKLGGDKAPVLYTDEINGQQVCRDDVWLCTTDAFTHPSPPDGMAGWISVDERLPEVGVTVLVYEPFRHGEDWPGTVRILFDYICPDYEDWHDHCASHEHFMAVGGANACGPDVTCTGPSEKAPYTHWMPLPAAPGPADGESNELC